MGTILIAAPEPELTLLWYHQASTHCPQHSFITLSDADDVLHLSRTGTLSAVMVAATGDWSESGLQLVRELRAHACRLPVVLFSLHVPAGLQLVDGHTPMEVIQVWTEATAALLRLLPA